MATETLGPTAAQLEQMHTLYRQGGADRAKAPHVIYAESNCPYEGCSQSLQAIDFRLEAFGRSIHDPLVRVWWNDVGFVGKCPSCGGWVHFTIRGKLAVDDAHAQTQPQLPANWADEALVL
ncbi:MAG: hypothetical protein WD851_07025 [Pirellulales bacterium]